MIQINKTHSNGKTATQTPTTKAEKRQYKLHSNGKTATKAPVVKTEKRQYKTHSIGKTATKTKKYLSCPKGYCHNGHKASTWHKNITQ